MLNDMCRCTNDTCTVDCGRKKEGGDNTPYACFAPDKPKDYENCRYRCE